MPERLALPESPWLIIGVILGALVAGYWMIAHTSVEFRIYLIWAFAVAVLALALVIKYASTYRALWLVVAIGLVVKLFGSALRYEVIVRAYDNNADAGVYFGQGLSIARQLWHLDLSGLLSAQGPTLGTRYLARVAGVVVSISGPSEQAAFVVFSLLAFAGMLLYASSYSRVAGAKPVTYLAWLVVWPSLVFWPSSVGKEAFLVFALALAVWGYSRLPAVSAWPALSAGLLLTGLIRPHIAAVAVTAMVVAAVVRKGRRGITGAWYFQAIFGAAALVLTYYLSANALGVDSAESAVTLVQQQAAQSNIGGSAVGAVTISPLHIPNAFVHALFRPFIWEAHGLFMLAAALEVLVLIVLIIWRRKQLWASLREWRSDRLLGFSLVFVILYALMLGFSMGNLAIIARERVLLIPMLLLLLQRREPPVLTREGIG